MKKIIIIILAIGFSWSLKAQQLNSFSQTIENKYLINNPHFNNTAIFLAKRNQHLVFWRLYWI